MFRRLESCLSAGTGLQPGPAHCALGRLTRKPVPVTRCTEGPGDMGQAAQTQRRSGRVVRPSQGSDPSLGDQAGASQAEERQGMSHKGSRWPGVSPEYTPSTGDPGPPPPPVAHPAGPVPPSAPKCSRLSGLVLSPLRKSPLSKTGFCLWWEAFPGCCSHTYLLLSEQPARCLAPRVCQVPAALSASNLSHVSASDLRLGGGHGVCCQMAAPWGADHAVHGWSLAGGHRRSGFVPLFLDIIRASPPGTPSHHPGALQGMWVLKQSPPASFGICKVIQSTFPIKWVGWALLHPREEGRMFPLCFFFTSRHKVTKRWPAE